jgi:class 3 adenylate cyclase
VETPEVRYATSTGGVDIAWQQFGRADGPRLVWVSGFISHLDLNWEAVPYAALLRGLGRSCRVLAFDKRGTGLSGRDLGFGSLEERTDDVRAVMDAAGWEAAHLFGMSEGGPMSILLAAAHPQRVLSLSLYGTGARFVPAPGYPHGYTGDSERMLTHIRDRWGTGRVLVAPIVAHSDEAPPGAVARFERNASTPKVAAEIMARNLEIDVRALLPTLNVPTLVVHARGDGLVPVELGRYLAAHIPGARYVELPLDIHGSWHADDYEPLLDAVTEFVAGTKAEPSAERTLATVLFTDVVGSTDRAAAVGDRRWRALLDTHDATSARLVGRFGGRVVKHTGDGLLATFDSPGQGVRCARELGAALAAAGLPIRAGLHTGEVERRGDDVGGIAVHIAARVAALAGAGQVLVSRTVRDLVVGSELAFADRGSHELKGVPDPWQLYEAVTP